MGIDDIKQSLHDDEKKVLLALKGKKKMSESEIARLTGMPLASVSHASLWLYSKGLVNINEKRLKYIELNDEGKQYLKKGLPERRAINAIGKKEILVKDVEDAIGKNVFKIAIAWLMRNGLATISNGKIKLTDAGLKALKSKMDTEKAIGLLKTRKSIDEIPENALKIIEKRGKVINKTEETLRTIELTDKGKDIIKSGIEIGKDINVLTTKHIENWKKYTFRPYNIKAEAPPLKIGKGQPYKAMLDEARDHLTSMGFVEVRGPIIETEFWNFDALFQPQFHPARSMSDTYYIKKPKKGELPKGYSDLVRKTHENGWKTGSTGWRYTWDPEKAKRLILRTHTTAVSVRTMVKNNGIIPGKYFTIARNFRHDVIDATHLPEFYQCEGIVVEENMTFKNLLGMLKEFAMEFAHAKKVRFQPSYFPYTEPSVELFAKHPKIGWIELGGAGMFRPEVRLPTGIDCEVMAWGLGFDRLSMLKLGINDIRQLFSTDLKWLEDTKIRYEWV
ncbi:MAG: phenylalanine--tRNA ligase subunit alpha [Candidatus Diapherotrites archaeon]|nr:phenylalanine--tRNA ligase subunit alpha [Candidatus Diapherotrites archaeon]